MAPRGFRAGLKWWCLCFARLPPTSDNHPLFSRVSAICSWPRRAQLCLQCRWDTDSGWTMCKSHAITLTSAPPPQGYAPCWGVRGRKVQAQPCLSRSERPSYPRSCDGRVCVWVLPCRKGKHGKKVCLSPQIAHMVPQAVKRVLSWRARRETCHLGGGSGRLLSATLI